MPLCATKLRACNVRSSHLADWREFCSQRILRTFVYKTRETAFLSGVTVAVKRILLVEDEPTTREILAEVLRGDGYTVDTVASVSAANVCLRSLAYELVVADWLLPDGDGVAVVDAAAALGFKTLVVSGVISQLPGDAHLRHRLIVKSLGFMAVVSAVRAAIGSP